MGRKYTKRLSNRKNTKRKNTKRKNTKRNNTLKSRVSKRKNTLKSRVSKRRKNSLNRRNNLKRLKKKRSNKKRLFKGGAVWDTSHEGGLLFKRIGDLENLSLPNNRLGQEPNESTKNMLKALWEYTNNDEDVKWQSDAPDEVRQLVVEIYGALDTFTPEECNQHIPIYLDEIDAFWGKYEESGGESDWETDDY